MKAATAIAFAILLAGCASDPYLVGYNSDGYYDGYAPYTYATPYYAPYYTPYYAYPSIGAGIYYYDHDGRDRRYHYRDRDWRRDRGPGERHPHPSREPLDTRHGERGNEAGR